LALAAGNPGQLADRESSGTDSDEDVEGSDDHKLAQLKHAIEGTKQPVQVILNGRYRWGDGWDSVSHRRAFKERTAYPEIMEYLRVTAEAIGTLAVQAGAAALPIGIQGLAVDRDQLEVRVVKRGPGLQLYFERREEAIEPKSVHQLKFRAMFWEGLSIVYGTNTPTTDGEISVRLSSITASWLGDRFGESWQVRLSAEPKTSELGDEIYASVLLATDDSWQGIRRIPGLPSIAAPLVNSGAATKIEEAVSLIQYAWGAGWPVRGTIALTIDYGTDHAWEFSVTYTLGRYEGEPTWEALWALMSTAMNQDGIVTPQSMSQDRESYSASCEKFNQTIMILWRQKLPDQTLPSIPQDHGLPDCTVYEAYATLKLRGFQRLGLGVREIVESFYGEGMKVEPTQSRNWSYNATMRREGENPVWSEEATVQVSTAENPPVVPGFNEALWESSEIVANVDKGSQHYIKFFRDELPVTAAIRVEKGHHGDYGWGVYFEQGRHRRVLAGTVVDRPEEEVWEDTLWTACAEWASFEPVLGR
jgi:hypothetical protein